MGPDSRPWLALGWPFVLLHSFLFNDRPFDEAGSTSFYFPASICQVSDVHRVRDPLSHTTFGHQDRERVALCVSQDSVLRKPPFPSRKVLGDATGRNTSPLPTVVTRTPA